MGFTELGPAQARDGQRTSDMCDGPGASVVASSLWPPQISPKLAWTHERRWSGLRALCPGGTRWDSCRLEMAGCVFFQRPARCRCPSRCCSDALSAPHIATEPPKLRKDFTFQHENRTGAKLYPTKAKRANVSARRRCVGNGSALVPPQVKSSPRCQSSTAAELRRREGTNSPGHREIPPNQRRGLQAPHGHVHLHSQKMGHEAVVAARSRRGGRSLRPLLEGGPKERANLTKCSFLSVLPRFPRE